MNLLYQQNQFPIFQNRMYETADAALNCPKGEIKLVKDPQTGLVFNAAFRPEVMVYDGHYQNEQAVSLLFQQHLKTVARLIGQTMGRDRLVEVGCGKGYFLELLLGEEFNVTGFDPAYEGSNPRVQRKYFAPGVIEKAQGLILRHVLEHIENPVKFLGQLKLANGGQGKIYIEVPCLDWICEQHAWFDIFYEHVNYFRLSDFKRIFGKIHESGHIFGGQYLYIIAELSSLDTTCLSEADGFCFPADFLDTVAFYAEMIKAQSLDSMHRHQSIIWGGASKGVIFALFMQRAGACVDFVIDINPAKQGRYLAATGLRVSSPKEALAQVEHGSTIFVMNGNYLPEIRQMTFNKFNYIVVDYEKI
jgi:hypothetical protein